MSPLYRARAIAAAVILATLSSGSVVTAQDPTGRFKLRVVLFKYIPDAAGDQFAALTSRIKKEFEDASEAPVEMQARRIGANELDAIEICHGYVEAQVKYASEDRDKDGMLKYASHLMSTSGRKDGLYWDGASEPLVPEGFARAAWDGAQKGQAKPYHGYYFRVLDGQGSNAPEGPHNYLVKGKLVGGFGLVAWPAEYGATGIHTFIVNQDGVVYEKDTAPVPGKAPVTITRFDPDHSWEPVEEAPAPQAQTGLV